MEKTQMDILKLVDHPVTIAVITTFVGIYTSTVAPELPDFIKKLYDNKIFSFLVILLVSYMSSSRRPVVAVVCAVSFMLISQYLSTYKVSEAFLSSKDDLN